jgi:predicted dehydrogenase
MSVMAEFADAITARRQPLTDGMTGLRVLALLEAASQSAERGGTRISLKTGERR